MTTPDYILQFREGIPPRGMHPSAGDFQENGESAIYKFGYKVLRGEEVYTVVDWANIESFITKLVEEAEARGKKQGIQEAQQDYFEAGKLESTDGLLSALEGMYEQYCQDGHQFMSAGERAEIVTLGENTLRGNSPTARNARKTHCSEGHPLSGDNVVIKDGGRRRCKMCLSKKI